MTNFVRFMINHHDLITDENWSADFIQQSKNYFDSKNNYTERHYIIQGIFKAWELVKEKVNQEDLNWLTNAAQNISQGYKQLPSRYQRIMADFSQYLEFLNTYKKIILGVGMFVGSMIAIPYKLSSMWHEARQGAINMIRELQQIREQTPNQFTEQEWKMLDDAMNMNRRVYNLRNLDEAANDNIDTLVNVYPYMVAAAALPITYYAYRSFTFFREPSEARPIPLPNWLHEHKQALDSIARVRLHN